MKLSRLTMGMLQAMVGIAFFSLTSQGTAYAKGPKLIHTESVAAATINGIAFGPAGPNCDVAAGGSACTFLDATATSVGQNEPLGKYNGAVSVTLLLNPAYFIPSGAHDAAGNPTGICTPEFGTETDTFSDGSTLSSNFQGLGCCAGPDCTAGLGTGPPSVNHDSSVITGGTKRLSGAAGGFSSSDSSTTGPLLVHYEGVLQLP